MRTLDDFTGDDLRKIETVFKNEYKDVSAEDIALAVEFEKAKAYEDARASAELQQYADIAAARIEATKEQHKTAMKNLKDIKNAAMKRLAEVKRYD